MNPNTRRLHEMGQRIWLDNIFELALQDLTQAADLFRPSGTEDPQDLCRELSRRRAPAAHPARGAGHRGRCHFAQPDNPSRRP